MKQVIYMYIYFGMDVQVFKIVTPILLFNLNYNLIIKRILAGMLGVT